MGLFSKSTREISFIFHESLRGCNVFLLTFFFFFFLFLFFFFQLFFTLFHSDETLSVQTREYVLIFLINSFQSLENELVRQECLKLVSPSIWVFI